MGARGTATRERRLPERERAARMII
jgi:hypothetical protein